MTTTPQTLSSLAGRLRLSCTLHYQGREYAFDWPSGVAECLSHLMASAADGEQDFGQFCSDGGYDPDSRKAERLWAACHETSEAMRRLLGGDWEEFARAEHDI